MHPIDETVVRRLANGNEEALLHIYNAYGSKVYDLVYQFFQSHEIAREVTQEIFSQIWIQRKAFQRVADFKSTFRTITREVVTKTLTAFAAKYASNPTDSITGYPKGWQGDLEFS